MYQILNQEDPAGKIDGKSVNGLEGVKDSLSYKVEQIERHFHSAGSWFGVAASPSATNKADRIGDGIAAFEIDAGNETWGAWVQILGSDDTPARSGMVYFDPHEMIVTDTEDAAIYFIQITRGASGAAGLAAGLYTEIIYNATVQKETAILNIHTGRAPAGSLLWARCLALGQNTSTMNFYIGLHEYEG